MISKFKKKPMIVEAVKLESTPKSIREVLGFKGAPVVTNCNAASDAFEGYCNQCIKDGGIKIVTLEGVMLASFGDYVIHGIQGEFYPCKPDIFHQTYDPV